ncbi:eCIS core domain-containing protein [Kitasatospora sp. NPDC054768]
MHAREAARTPDGARSGRRGADSARTARTAAVPVRPGAGLPSPQEVAALQRTVGNAAVARMFEEARHRHGPGCGHQEPDGGGAPVQRSAVHRVLGSPGRPLDAGLREEMEQRLQADFSDVRVHTGTAAQRSAQEVGARAYTSGSHVVLGAAGADKHTLAHELTHVIQQRNGPVAGTDHGNGLRVSDPSDRFEREAEATARRVMAAPVQRAVAVPDAPGRVDRAPGGAAPAVQRVVTVARGTIGSSGETDKVQWNAGRHKNLPEADRKAILAEIGRMADAEESEHFTSYEKLIDAAHARVRAASGQNLAPVTPVAVATGALQHTLTISDEEQMKRHKEVRRRLSLRGVSLDLEAFRNRQAMVNPFTYSDVEDGASYTIGAGGNFVLGSVQEGDYSQLFDLARSKSGLTEQQLANRFIKALSESGSRPFDDLPKDAQKYCAKIVAIIQGAEFRRAAANPTAAVAAFNKVVTGETATLHEAMNTFTLFAKAGGGSADSQYHRAGKEPDAELNARILQEFRSLAQLVSANGFDPNDEKQFYTACETIAVGSMNSFKSNFSYTMT